MTRAAIVDTGPLVALLDRDESHHAWAVGALGGLASPLLVCEPVLTEAMYLLSGLPDGIDEIYRLLDKGALRLALHLDRNLAEVRALQRKYRDQPMSLADACVVRMAEIHAGHGILTLDSDFAVYRKHGRQPLELIRPPKA
ncbi:MAG: PIN domain-containing protein [Planctomycetia bacterium]|nr:PIN domain-containing protein [Planctomycetia bacterium]